MSDKKKSESSKATGNVIKEITAEEIKSNERRLKYKTMKIRSSMGILMGFTAIGLTLMGHFYTSILIVVAHLSMYFEILSKPICFLHLLRC